jgi:hypothetical protein
LDAWNRGWEIQKSLNLNVDKNQYQKQQREALLTYYV